jgi:hypothetical protein
VMRGVVLPNPRELGRGDQGIRMDGSLLRY